MKGLTHIVLGSIAGGLLGASAFFAVDALMPFKAEALEAGEREQTSVHLFGDAKLSNGNQALYSCTAFYREGDWKYPLQVNCYDD